MKKFDFWNWKLRLDDYFFECINIAQRLFFFIKKLGGNFKYMKKNKELKNIYSGQRAFLVANGPSIKDQDLKPLKNEITFFVNRSFLHEDYSYIKPTYHIFIDSKLATGEWEISMLDEVLKNNPSVIFLLNYKWFYLKKFKPYINNPEFKIYWVNCSLFTTPFIGNKDIDITNITYGSAVTGVAFMCSIYMGVKDFFFLGQDGNGLCYELTDRDSHFYGSNPENGFKKPKDVAKDLYMMHLSIKHWCYFSDYCKRIGFNVYNCGADGVFNMFERVKFELEK